MALYSVRQPVSTGLRRAARRNRSRGRQGGLSPTPGSGGIEEEPLDRSADLDDFLRGVEKQAYVMARSMTGDPEEAMDIVQDAMFRFVRRYSRRPATEWRPLFFRILVNRTRDFHRRNAVRLRVMSLFRRDDSPDPVDVAPGPRIVEPAVEVAGQEAMAALEQAMTALPARQKEAFSLRCLEGLDVAATARIMGCSDGSVKTHYSRALSALRHRLGEHYDA